MLWTVYGARYDPEAAAKSPMLRQKTICDGQLTGRCCVHFWRHVVKVDTVNPEHLRRGQTILACTMTPDETFGFSSDTMPVECNRYRPRGRGLRAWLRLAPDPGAYREDPYLPLAPDEKKDDDAGTSGT